MQHVKYTRANDLYFQIDIYVTYNYIFPILTENRNSWPTAAKHFCKITPS